MDIDAVCFDQPELLQFPRRASFGTSTGVEKRGAQMLTGCDGLVTGPICRSCSRATARMDLVALADCVHFAASCKLKSVLPAPFSGHESNATSSTMDQMRSDLTLDRGLMAAFCKASQYERATGEAHHTRLLRLRLRRKLRPLVPCGSSTS